MIQAERILVVEIKAIDNPGFDSSQLKKITINQVSGEFFLNNSFLIPIKSAVLDGVISLGSNFRHPLLFTVQIIPNDFQNPNSNKPPSRRRRRRRKN